MALRRHEYSILEAAWKNLIPAERFCHDIRRSRLREKNIITAPVTTPNHKCRKKKRKKKSDLISAVKPLHIAVIQQISAPLLPSLLQLEPEGERSNLDVRF